MLEVGRIEGVFFVDLEPAAPLAAQYRRVFDEGLELPVEGRARHAGAAAAGKLGFGKYASTAWAGAQLVLDTANGNVGIGTDAPAGLLHVASAAGNPDVIISSGTTDATLKLEAAANAIFKLTSAGSGNSYIDYGTAGQDSHLHFRADNAS